MTMSKPEQYINPLDPHVLAALETLHAVKEKATLFAVYADVHGSRPNMGLRQFFSCVGFLVKREYIAITDARDWTCQLTPDGVEYLNRLGGN